MSNLELQVALQMIKNDYYGDSQLMEEYTIDEYAELHLEDYLGL
jgi:hypothetical protein